MSIPRSTQIGIIGSGPAGLLLSQLLANAGIDSVVIDRQSRAHIEGRVRAGVLEWGSVEALRAAGVGQRMDHEGLIHEGFDLAFAGQRHRIDLVKHTGKPVMVYGQTELTKDLIAKRLHNGGALVFEATDVCIEGIDGPRPTLNFVKDGMAHEVTCDFIAGCDGFHGVSRKAIPTEVLKTYELEYPFGWLGILVEQPPVSHELIYANHERGFALCSMRSPTRSRYYLQCDANDDVANWPDDRFWDELTVRIGTETAANLQRGPSFEKSIAPLRSFVAEPMRHGGLFLAGDAAHIVPPTGAKGLNLAIADVQLLAHAFGAYYQDRNSVLIDSYSERCLKRVWKVERFSWSLSRLMHQFPASGLFERRMQQAEFDYIVNSEAASRSIAENYVGLPLDLGMEDLGAE